MDVGLFRTTCLDPIYGFQPAALLAGSLFFVTCPFHRQGLLYCFNKNQSGPIKCPFSWGWQKSNANVPGVRDPQKPATELFARLWNGAMLCQSKCHALGKQLTSACCPMTQNSRISDGFCNHRRGKGFCDPFPHIKKNMPADDYILLISDKHFWWIGVEPNNLAQSQVRGLP